MILTLVANVLCGDVPAQNLVLNPSFETFKQGLPVVPANRFISYGVNGWYMPTEGTPDWYCNIETDSNPIPAGFRSQYWAGKVDPHGGHSFAGFGAVIAHVQLGKIAEYIGGTLTKPLSPGHKYTFSFWMRCAPNADMYLDNFGVYFSSSRIDAKGHSNLKYNPQLLVKIDTARRWTYVQGDFIATGGEEFFVIGNFERNLESSGKYISAKRNALESSAYYYVDDFSVIDINASVLSIKAGQKLIFNNIYFESGKSTIQLQSFAPLDQVVAAMKKQSKLKVEISGHTDSDGTPESNQTLSEQRAIAVKQYFISKGIDSTRISTVGYGSTKTISSDKSKNRRVEFYFSE